MEEDCLDIDIVEDNRQEGEEQFTVELNIVDDEDFAIVPPRRATIIIMGETIL